ncbi:GNAT family N-acetyltransferase [Kribbella sp. NPDC050281]|uniref:GNAT family N-acetyltransferase n=1 Tax=Kribbella sp. NPDC050281 TaxID=3155515 RepID=UPI0033C5ED3C
MDIGARIARAQLAGLAASRRQIVAGPLTGLLHDDDTWYLSGMVATEPGEPFDQDAVPEALAIIRRAFAAEGRWLSAEFIDEASPGLADVLEANGMTIASRPPLLAVEPAGLLEPDLPDVVVSVVRSEEEQAEANAVAVEAYESEDAAVAFEPDPAGGGWILLRVDGVPVASASWGAVSDGVTEIAGVSTIHSHRRRGLGAIATAYATRQSFELGGATLAWLTPGDDGSDRIYRRLGFTPRATAVHLGDPGGHLADLR